MVPRRRGSGEVTLICEIVEAGFPEGFLFFFPFFSPLFQRCPRSVGCPGEMGGGWADVNPTLPLFFFPFFLVFGDGSLLFPFFFFFFGRWLFSGQGCRQDGTGPRSFLFFFFFFFFFFDAVCHPNWRETADRRGGRRPPFFFFLSLFFSFSFFPPLVYLSLVF